MGLESVTVDSEYDGALAAENGEIRISLLGKLFFSGIFIPELSVPIYGQLTGSVLRYPFCSNAKKMVAAVFNSRFALIPGVLPFTPRVNFLDCSVRKITRIRLYTD